MVEYVGTVADITERKAGKEAMQKLQSELARVIRVMTMGELAATIAHEVNQPMGAIANNANVALKLASADTADSRRELSDVLADIVTDSNRASAIIARMRGLMRRVLPATEPVSISDAIRDVLSLAERELAERRIRVHLELARDMAPVLADRIQCQQLMLNLVMNAVEAMSDVPDERRVLSIRGQPSEHDGKPAVLITMHDMGCGFSVDDPERLFEALYTTKSDGLGMGLRISRSIAEVHGGALWAEANADVGATFFCLWPSAETAKS